MKDFKKIVRYMASDKCQFQYPLRNGMDTFLSGVDYVIEDKEDYLRLMNCEHGEFIDVTPAPKAKVEDEGKAGTALKSARESK